MLVYVAYLSESEDLHMNSLSVGFARVNITPMMGIGLVGYFVPRFADGVLDDLEVNALALASGEQNSTMGAMLVCGYAILNDVQITAQNRQRGTYDVTLTGCKNLINEIRRLRSSEGHYLKTADGHYLAAPHEA